jgi:hypothetical protein
MDMPNKSLNEYVTIHKNDEGRFYSVHMGGQLFYCGHDADYNPIWSDNLQDVEIHCRESAEIICALYPGASFDPISVDLHVIA